MDIQEKHRVTLLNAKCQVVCMAENLMKKMQHGDNIDCCVKKLFVATRLINRLDCYCFPTNDTGCNNCITDTQLNKMYQALDSLLQ
jgi:hypothetical protein